jgi:hypothetical protein
MQRSFRFDGFACATGKCELFLQNFATKSVDSDASPKYMDMLVMNAPVVANYCRQLHFAEPIDAMSQQEIANRRRKALEIDIDDLERVSELPTVALSRSALMHPQLRSTSPGKERRGFWPLSRRTPGGTSSSSQMPPIASCPRPRIPTLSRITSIL